MTETKIFAPDTNFFLQFKDPKELPWAELGTWSIIRLVILDTVLGEIDKHKNGHKGRVARKARNLHQKLRPLFNSKQDELVLRESRPRILLQLGPHLPINREPHPLLDRKLPDHRIVDEALATREQLEGLTLLSDDGIATRKAVSVGLETEMPPDEWRLPPEPDESQKRIQELERKIVALTAQAPILTVSMLQDGEAVSAFRGTITRYRPTTEHFRTLAMEAIHRQFPDEGSHYLVGYARDRKKWVNQTLRRLTLHHKVAGMVRGLEKLTLAFENQGTVTAEGMEVKVALEGELLLVDVDELADFSRGDQVYRSAPKPNVYLDPIHRPVPAHLDGELFNRNPRRLSWGVDEPELGSKSAWGHCEDFRHQAGAVERNLLLSGIKDQEATQVNGQLIVRMSAKNLPEPVVKHFPLHIDFKWMEADEDARLQLAQDLGVHIPG